MGESGRTTFSSILRRQLAHVELGPEMLRIKYNQPGKNVESPNILDNEFDSSLAIWRRLSCERERSDGV
jgi:hypothetical protein